MTNQCTLNGCNNKAVRDLTTDNPLCEMHYYRRRRNGHFNLFKYPDEIICSHGYVSVRDSTHPLSDGGGRVYKHRQVLYDSNPDMHCFDCGILQTWNTCHVDHIDEDKENNAIDNLRVSCPICNQSRGRQKQKRAMRDMAPQITFNGVTHCVSEWAEVTGITRSAIMLRIKKGWSIKRTLTTPTRHKARSGA